MKPIDQTHPLRLTFYGDDFTGSTDALEVLAFAGLRCALFLQVPSAETLQALGGFDAIGIAGESRAMSPTEMSAALPPIFNALAQLAPPLIHYKVCSTFDSSPTLGSIGRVMEIAKQRFGPACIPIVAGTPSLSRFCAFGNLFAKSGVDGKIYRIDRHPIMSVHPITPLHESDLSKHLGAQTELVIGKFELPNFDLPPAATALSLQEAQACGMDALLFDSTTPAHLTQVGRLLQAHALRHGTVFVVGSSGVESAMTQWWREGQQDQDQAQRRAQSGRFEAFAAVDQVLAVSGSASALSALQIGVAIAAGFSEVAIDACALVDDERWTTTSAQLVAQVVALLECGQSVMLHSARGPEDARIAQLQNFLVSQGQSLAQAKHSGGRLLGFRLGLMVQEILRSAPQKRLLLSGGDTASQITQVLAPDALEIEARLAPGAPLCRVISLQPHLRQLQIALKGGQMGGADFFVKARQGRN